MTISEFLLILCLVSLNMFSILCLLQLKKINEHITKNIQRSSMFNGTVMKTLDDIKLILMSAYGVNNIPRPGKMQQRIRPIVHTDSELYDKER